MAEWSEQEGSAFVINDKRIPPWVKDPAAINKLEKLAQELREKIESDEAAELVREPEELSALVETIIQDAFLRISSAMDRYESRSEQIKMARQILTALLTNRNAVIEAGTGTGKSFAYLIASLAYSYLSGNRVLLSTQTKNLQSQLFEKDLPFLAKSLDPSISFSLAQGSGNYFCSLRYDFSLADGALRNEYDSKALESISAVVKKIREGLKDGQQSDFSPPVPGRIWSLMNRDSDGCTGSRCDHYSSCNYYRVKKKWENSRLIVSNHHLFLFNLLNDKKLLPVYGAVILDEGHSLPSIAYDIFTSSWSEQTMEELRKLFTTFRKHATSVSPEDFGEIAEDFENSLSRFAAFIQQWTIELNLLYDDDKSVMAGATRVLVPSTAVFEKFLPLLSKLEDEKPENADSRLISLAGILHRRLAEMRRFLAESQKTDFTKSHAVWGEKRGGQFTLKATNMLLSNLLKDTLSEIVIYTSATLGYYPKGELPRKKGELLQGGYFSSFLSEAILGGEGRRLMQDVFFSPFRYRENSVLYVPQGFDQPEHSAPYPEKKKYETKVFQEIIRLAELAGGGTLVLFTSNAMLRSAYEFLLENTELEVFSQLELGPNYALKSFLENNVSILLGSASFWQGVDIPGKELRMLIITKLMFTPPDDPIFQYRSARVEEKGGKPFMELALPFASTMLRQAYGRLIRSENDRGVVAILDSRLHSKFYGKILLSNLPGTEVSGSFEQLKELTRGKDIF